MNEGGNYNGGVLFDAFSVRVERTEEGSHAPTDTYVGETGQIRSAAVPRRNQQCFMRERNNAAVLPPVGMRCVKY